MLYTTASQGIGRVNSTEVVAHWNSKASEAAATAQIDSGANKNSSLLDDDIPPEKLGQPPPSLLSVLELWRWQNAHR